MCARGWVVFAFIATELLRTRSEVPTNICVPVLVREDFLQFLNQRGKKVYLVTNAHPKTLEIKLLNESFHHYFDEVVSTHRFEVPKEEQLLWQRLEQHLKFDKSKTLFIDDSLAILDAARQFGIAYLYGIAQPDSQQAPRKMTPYFALDHFSQLMNAY